MNAFELAILRVARQYEAKLRNGPVLSDAERRQGERVLRWAKPILEKRNQWRNPDERFRTSLGN
jgi:hypothetical protein